MLQRAFFILGILLLAGISFSTAADNNKVSVFISYAGEDAIGQRVATVLEELIRASSDYKMAPSHEAMMKVAIVSLDPDAASVANMRSAISTVITMRNYLSYDPADPQTWYPIFLSANLMVIGSARADDLAGQTLDKVGAALERYRSDVRKYQ